MGKRIFIIGPVRGATPEQNKVLDDYVAELENEGHHVHLPKRDTDQSDTNGYDILTQNCNAIRTSNEVHIYYIKTSDGSKFDIGCAFAYEKPLKLINRDDVKPTAGKSFENVLLHMDDLYRTR